MLIPSAKTRIIKAKRCKAPDCGNEFMPLRPMQKACSPGCALSMVAYANAKKATATAKADRKETKTKLEKLKSRSQHVKDAQTAFNAWIRLRDENEPCISCGRHHDGQYHAGHYLSTGARPELRFHEWNVNKQCQPCNTHLSGNLLLYRVWLIKKIGYEAVSWLEGPHEPAKYTIDELKQIKADYTQKAKDLRNG